MTTETDDFIRAMLREVKRSPLVAAVGRVYITPAASGAPAFAEVFGITETPIVVGPESWGSPFRSEVNAGSVDSKSVLVLFSDGQPIVCFTIGI